MELPASEVSLEAEGPSSRVTVLLFGLGHIGGSLALALSRMGVDLVLYDPDPDARARFEELGVPVLGGVRESIAEACSHEGPVLLLLASPTDVIVDTVTMMLPVLEVHCAQAGSEVVLCDLASVKSGLFDGIDAGVNAIGAGGVNLAYLSLHPMAGREGSGHSSADGRLFEGSTWMLVPSTSTSASSILLVMEVMRGVAERFVVVPVDMHDSMVALISGLPHVLSSLLAREVARSDGHGYARVVAGGSFRDVSRVSQSDASKVASMLLPNAMNVVGLLQSAILDLESLVSSLMDHDAEGVRAWVAAGRLRDLRADENSHVVQVPAESLVEELLGRFVGSVILGLRSGPSGSVTLTLAGGQLSN